MIEIAGYEVAEQIGSGTGGAVYRARQVSGDRVVAVKRVLDPDVAARLQQEGIIQAGLEHPHILRVYDLVPDGDGFAIVMQYAGGGSLADRLAGSGPPDEAIAVRIVTSIGEALAFAHDQGVVHRDVKPSNILFDAAGTVLLADFGLATSSGDLVAGSAGYLDPALLAGQPPGRASDTYSLAVVAYELLTGELPYPGNTVADVTRAIAEDEPVSLADHAPRVTPTVADVIGKALRKDPNQRYPRTETFLAALQQAAGSSSTVGAGAPDDDDPRGTRTFGPRPVPAEEDKKRRLPWPVVGALAFALVALPVLGVTLINRDDGPNEEVVDQQEPEDVLPFQGVDPLLDDLIDDMDCDASEPEIEDTDEIHMARLEPGTCPVPVHREGGTLVAHVDDEDEEEMRFDVGASDDIIVIADFTCTGRDTPAVYRSDTGEVFVFERWADERRPVIEVEGFDSGVVAGIPDVQVDSNGCADLEIREPPGQI